MKSLPFASHRLNKAALLLRLCCCFCSSCCCLLQAGHHSGSNTTIKEAATGQPRTDAATDQQHAAEREQQFLSWLSQEGASFESIRLGRSAAGLRGVFAAANLSKGDLLVAVPHHVILKLPYSSNDDFCEQGEALMLALLQRDPAHVAHLDVLPTLEESRMSPDT